MNIFGKVGDSITATSKGVADKAKSASEINGMKKQIQQEEQKVLKYYQTIGQRYYDENAENPNAKYYDIMCEIKQISERNERLKFKINQIRGIKVCPNCGAEINNDFIFCGICGTKLPEPPKEDETDINEQNYDSVPIEVEVVN